MVFKGSRELRGHVLRTRKLMIVAEAFSTHLRSLLQGAGQVPREPCRPKDSHAVTCFLSVRFGEGIYWEYIGIMENTI